MFSSLMRDTVDLLKRDGSSTKGLRAAVQRGKVFMVADGPVIETGDLILRHMSTGAEETLEVVDPGFQERHGGIPAHYQLRVKRLDAPGAAAAVQSITYNVSGPNARINQNSVDGSVNIVAADPRIAEVFEALRSEIEGLTLTAAERDSALEIVTAVRGQVESPAPSRAVVAALLSALPTVSSVTSIVASILGMLK